MKIIDKIQINVYLIISRLSKIIQVILLLSMVLSCVYHDFISNFIEFRLVRDRKVRIEK